MFDLESKNTILDVIKILKQKDGQKEYVTAHKLTFICECDAEMAHILMGGKTGQKPIDWWEGEYEDIKYHGLSGSFKSKAEFVECAVKFRDVPLKDALVKELSFVPENGGKVKVTLSAQMILNDKQIVKIERYYKTGGKLTIKTDSVFDPLDGSGEQSELPIDD